MENETYIVVARTNGSSVSVATEDPLEALKRSLEMEQLGSTVTIVDRDGFPHTLAEVEAAIVSGRYAKPSSSTG